MAPKFTGYATLRYQTQSSPAGHGLFGQISYEYRGSTYLALDLDPNSIQRHYGLWDAQIALSLAKDRMKAWLWGKNLTNKYFVEMIYDTRLDTGGQVPFFLMNADRKIGATVKFRF